MIAAAAGPKRILVIEDNPDLAYGLRNNLEIEGYDVEVAKDGTRGLQRARSAPNPDLVVLDLMLPGMDGFRVLRTLRDEGHSMPVLILTARGEEADKVRGLRLGADDYVTKPFGVLELLARIEALLRRVLGPKKNGGPPPPPFEKFGDIEILTPSRTVLRDGAPVALTPKEYDLLLALIRRDGACITRGELLTEVWGYSVEVMSRTVDTHVAELRRKLERDPANPQHILTVEKQAIVWRDERGRLQSRSTAPAPRRGADARAAQRLGRGQCAHLRRGGLPGPRDDQRGHRVQPGLHGWRAHQPR
jgi:DNA-binding response OmpR family regulator